MSIQMKKVYAEQIGIKSEYVQEFIDEVEKNSCVLMRASSAEKCQETFYIHLFELWMNHEQIKRDQT